MSLPIPSRIATTFDSSWERLAGPGTWWTGGERIALAELARSAFAERHLAPWMREKTAAVVELSDIDNETAEIMVKLAADAASIDRTWANRAVDIVGDGKYVEIVAVAASMAVIDAFAEAVWIDPSPLPEPIAGDPSGVRPDGIADIGAFVPMADPWSDANVARALTLSPDGNTLYRTLASALYHDGQFYDLDWDRPISRPQAETIATAVSAASQCFY